jgi:hypothetical protein
VRRELAEYRDRTMSIVASSDDNPAVLAKLAQNDPVADFIRTNRIRLLLCGGSSDWDGREYAGELAKLPGLHYVRTHPASTCRTGLASGVSHYRVVEVNGEDLSYVCPQDDSADRAQPSIACGSIGITGIPAGGELPASATVRIRNGLNQPFSNCNIWVRLRKNGTTRPAVAGGTLKQLYDGRTYWLCRIAVDLPDRGGLQIAASAEGQVPAPLPVSVEFSGPEELAFAPAKTEAGMGYYTCDEKLTITLRNRAAEPITLRPIIRLHGTALPIATPSDVAWPVTIAPSQSVAVPLRLVLPGVVEGRRYLQVSFVEDPLKRLYMRRVEIRKTGATTQSRP